MRRLGSKSSGSMDHDRREQSIGERGFNDQGEDGMETSSTVPPPDYFTVIQQLQRTSESGSTAAPLFHDIFLEVEGNSEYGHVECRSYRTLETERDVEFSAEFRIRWKGETKDTLLLAVGRCSTVAHIWMNHLTVGEVEAVLMSIQSNLTLLRISIYDPQPTEPTGDPTLEKLYKILGNILRSSRTLNRISLVDRSYRFTLTATGANYLASGLRDNSQSALASLEIWKLEVGSVVRHIAEIVGASASLTTLHLEKIGGLEDDAIDVLANALKQSKSLKYLSLGGIRQGAVGLLSKTFVRKSSNTSISSLVLKDEVEGMGDFLPQLLSSQVNSLSHLVLDSQEWIITLTSSQWRKVGRSLSSNGRLERLIIKVTSSWSWILPLEEMVTAAGVNKPNVELFLYSERSRQTRWFRSLEKVQLLSMMQTRSSEETAFSTSERKRSVTEVHMVSDNGLREQDMSSDAGFGMKWVTIAEAVASRPISLSALYLQMEPGSVEGVHSFIGALQDNSTIEKLTIDGGNARNWPGGWRSLFTSLRRNLIITELGLLNCEDLDDDDSFEVLMEALQVNKTLKVIKLSGSSWERNGKGALINEALKRSKEQEYAGMKRSGFQGGQLPSHASTSTDGLKATPEELSAEFNKLLQQLDETSESRITAADATGGWYIALGVEEGRYGRVKCSYRKETSSLDFSADFRMLWRGECKDRLLQTIGTCSTIRDIWVDHLSVTDLDVLLTPLQSSSVLGRISVRNPQAEPFHGLELERVCLALGRILHTSRSLHTLFLGDGSGEFTLSATCAEYLVSGLRGNVHSALSTVGIRKLEEGSVANQIATFVIVAPSLKELYLDDVGVLRDDTINTLAKALQQSTSLKYLSLGGIEEGAPALLSKVFIEEGSNQSITSLELKDTVKGMRYFLPQLLSPTVKLSNLILSGEWMTYLDTTQWRELGQSLSHTVSLERVMLRAPKSYSRHPWVKSIEEMLRAADLNRPDFKLIRNSLVQKPHDRPWSRSLKDLQLSAETDTSSRKGTDSAINRRKKPVIELHMSANAETASKAWIAIVKAVGSRIISLTALHLQLEPGLTKGLEGAKSFLEILQNRSTCRIQKLTIERGDKKNWPGGWKGLFTCLRDNRTLTTLKLVQCEDLDDDALRGLVDIIKVNSTLKVISLDNSSWEIVHDRDVNLLRETLVQELDKVQQAFVTLLKVAGFKSSGDETRTSSPHDSFAINYRVLTASEPDQQEDSIPSPSGYDDHERVPPSRSSVVTSTTSEITYVEESYVPGDCSSLGLTGDVNQATASERPEEYESGRDFSSKQSSSRSSPSKHSPTLRSDAVALGFNGFEDPFDPGRLLVIHTESSQADLDTSDEIVFLHDEGMALLFGVGLPFSKVVLRSSGQIAVYEVGETKWRQLWILTDSQIGSVLVFDARATEEDVFQRTESAHAGEIRGYVSDSKQAFRCHPLQSSRSPFSSLFAISSSLFARGSGGTNPDALLTEMNDSRGFSKAGGSSGVVATDVRREQQPEREVTIEIHLNPDTCAFEEDSSIPDQLSDHWIEPVLVLTFFKEPKGDQILRRFRSALDFKFYMSGKLNSDHEKFGWYHDDLKLSFKCLSRNVVTVDSEGVKGICRRMTGGHDTPVQNMEEGRTNNTGDTTDTTTGFYVKLDRSPGGISCSAFIADDYDIWDMSKRKAAFFRSGMMSDASFKLDGNWSIWSEGFTHYELIGTRNFILRIKRTSFPKTVETSTASESKVLQTIRKVFQIDHSFTFFEDLSTWQVWRIAQHEVAPNPISGMVDVVPLSYPGNRVPEGAIVRSQRVPRAGEQTFNASDLNQDSNEVVPIPGITTTLRTLPMANEVRDRETLSSESPTDSSHFPQVLQSTEHLNGERVATKLNDYIYELYKPTVKPDMEIIFCHGLNLDDSKNLHLSTWISGDVGTFHIWPKTWLAEDFPHAQVLTVSYDSSLYQTPELGRTDLHNTAESLMTNLWLLEDETPSLRPLILVGYSFGGILIKQLCLHAYDKIASCYHRPQSEAFLKRISAIYFMGTPHCGMTREGFEVPLQESSGPLFKDVELLNKELARLQQKFRDVRENYKWQISSVAETNETRWGAFHGVLVPESSARYGSGEQFVAVAADHRSLCKPSEKCSTVYRQLKALIKQAYRKIKIYQTLAVVNAKSV
ncbi:hypothetical protein R1sor_004772 [Riccia sorocarpa]|uniref:Uncharacterized protein n=1 Tax=Riccia sorocarpa TaxID=122646 RepID=A0ABD3HLX8_9MARC